MEYLIEMDFYQDWISHLREVLSKSGYKPSMDDQAVSMQYFNLQRRIISSRPRKVLIAKEFTCPSEHNQGLKLIKEKIKQGENLYSHLSRKIVDLDYDDDLLNDWDIYHLHLGTILEKDDFVNRTGPVLLARFDEHNAYFINVMEHGNWTNQEMIRIIHRNWPESIERFRIDEAVSISNTLTDQDIKQLRNSNALSFIEPLPGVVYAPPGMGLTTAGIGVEVVRASDHYANLIRSYEDIVRENIEDIANRAKAEGLTLKNNLSFILKIEEGNILAYEHEHNLTVNLGRLP